MTILRLELIRNSETGLRKQKISLINVLIVLALIMFSSNVNAQTAVNFQNTIQNIVQTSDRTLEFDIYLLNTDVGQTMELATYQAGITLNSGIYSGGVLTASIVPGSSTLTNISQVPTAITYTATATIIKLAAKAPPGSGAGSHISDVSPGTRIIRLKLTSTVPFISNSTPDFFFAPSTAVNPSYPTAVALYVDISGVVQNVQQPVAMGVNAFVLENPILNPPPSTFNVTGGGSYCEGTSGLPVGLDDSESGVTYTLFRNVDETVTTASGTGVALSFGNQTAGSYTVSGTNSGGTIAMTGEAVNEELLLPAAPVIGTITQPTCTTSTGSVVLTGLSSESWTINPGNITGSTPSTTISDLSASIYAFTVTVSGCTSAPGGEVIINAQPETPPKPVITLVDDYLESNSAAGNQWYNSSGIIIDATEQIYIPSENDNFYVIVTNTDGCASEASDIISFATGVEKNGLFEGILIFPNPVRDHLIIKNNSLLESIDFEIINSGGKVIYNSILNQLSDIGISHLSPGTYYIRFLTLNSYHQIKFIKL